MKRHEPTLAGLSRATIAGAFWVSTRFLFDVELHGLQYDTKASRTYYGMCHKRDLDPIVIIPAILFHRGWRGLAGDVHFALRSDGFSTGYLTRIAMDPRWFSRLIRVFTLGPTLRWLGAHPMQDLHLPAEEWIRELVSSGNDGLVGDTLAPTFIEELATVTGEPYKQIEAYHLSHLLEWRYQYALQHFYGTEIIVGPSRRPLERRLVARIKDGFANLDAWLRSGGSLYGSPEGQLSPDGRLSPINSGMHRLLKAAPPDTRIIPISVIYDFMTVQKMRIFIDLAPAIDCAPALPPKELDAQLRLAWLRSARFTCTQLASGFLIQAHRAGLSSFTMYDLADEVHQQAIALYEAGRHVDRQLLTLRGARRRAEGFLEYAVRHGLVRRTGHRAWAPTVTETVIKMRLREVGYDQEPLMYAWNELQELLSIQ